MPTSRSIRLITAGFPDDTGLDTAISRALLRRASEGEVPETLRLHVPGKVVAFGKHDVVTPGYREAVAATRRGGFEAIERLAGGRAAVFHPGTLAFAWTIPEPDPPAGIRSRFETVATAMAAAFNALGADAKVGPVAGEYCPGDYSVHVRASLKVMGVGQRLARGAAHVGGVVVVVDAAAVRDILVPVYAALGLDWRPDTAGALEDAVPGVTVAAAREAILAEFRRHATLIPGTLSKETVALAKTWAADHIAP